MKDLREEESAIQKVFGSNACQTQQGVTKEELNGCIYLTIC